MIHIRTLVLNIFLVGFGAPLLGSQEGSSALQWKIPFYHEMPEMNFNSQVFGLAGFTGIVSYMLYASYKKMYAHVYGPEKKSMTLQDRVLLQLLLDCAERDMKLIRSGNKRNLQVSKLKLKDMSPAYAAEAEYMRQQFVQISSLCDEDHTARELLEAFYAQWHLAITQACVSSRSLFAHAKAA